MSVKGSVFFEIDKGTDIFLKKTVVLKKKIISTYFYPADYFTRSVPFFHHYSNNF